MSRFILGLLAVSLGISGLLTLFASESPDGLERSLEKHSIHEGEPIAKAPMPDYEAPLTIRPAFRKAIAGITGTLILFGILILLGAALRRFGGKHRAPPVG